MLLVISYPDKSTIPDNFFLTNVAIDVLLSKFAQPDQMRPLSILMVILVVIGSLNGSQDLLFPRYLKNNSS